MQGSASVYSSGQHATVVQGCLAWKGLLIRKNTKNVSLLLYCYCTNYPHWPVMTKKRQLAMQKENDVQGRSIFEHRCRGD
jgi:hypothetical protein